MKLRAVVTALTVTAALAVAFSSWTRRCACHGCHCGLGCRCPKYWIPTLTEMFTIATIVSLMLMVGWRGVKVRWAAARASG